MVLFIVIFCVVVALGFAAAAAWSDWSGMVIPNSYSVGIIVSFIVAYGAFYFLAPESGYFMGIKAHGIALIIVFAITFILFSLRMLGAGDSKLAAAIALWTGFKGLMPFLFFMGIVGGILGLIALYLKKNKPIANPKEGSWFDRVQKGESAVPYGIAIAVGAVVAFFDMGYFDPEKLQLLAGAVSGS